MKNTRRKSNNSQEIERLRRENAILRSRIQSETSKGESNALFESKGYFSYLWKVIKAHSVYKLFEKYNGYFSRFRLISRVIKISAFIFIALQTSAILFISAVILSVVIPPIILGFATLLLISAARLPHDGKLLEEMIADRKVIILFPPRHCKFGCGGFLYRNICELADRGYAVIAVSPFMLSPKGVSESQRLFANIRIEDEKIFTIRRQYFFFINKRILQKHEKRVIYIH